MLRVKDTGIGMNEDESRARSSRSGKLPAMQGRDVEGTGLGLPLTKALTEANRATFSISSEPGKGTARRNHLSHH